MSKDSKEEIKNKLKELVKEIEELKKAHQLLVASIKDLEKKEKANASSKDESFIFMKD